MSLQISAGSGIQGLNVRGAQHLVIQSDIIHISGEGRSLSGICADEEAIHLQRNCLPVNVLVESAIGGSVLYAFTTPEKVTQYDASGQRHGSAHQRISHRRNCG